MIASLYPCVSFAGNCEQWVAKAVSVQGSVEAQRVGETQWLPVRLNNTYCPGDKIRVNEQSRAALSLVNQPLLRLDQNTAITLGGVKQKKTFVIELARGALHFFSRIRRNLEVRTDFVNVGVEGTEGFIRVEPDRTLITILDGQVLASNSAGSLVLTSGQSAVAEARKAPVGWLVARPRDAVHWALYYPPVMLFAPGEAPKEDPGNPHFLAYRASQLLAVGRVDKAGADIQRALNMDPNYSGAHALQAIIFVVQNEREKALGSAQKAVETGPNSATARIAMSYARQARFDLEGARSSVEEAVNLDPNNALAWARLAELWSSFGRLGKALDAAKKAVELNPNLARTQMVLGFAYLTQVKTAKSQAAFERAIELDQADPLSRLGLGLAIIREGDLQAGGREIEIAASLDPNNSIIRSYLGKVYFEKKKIGLDEREYAIAKELDPNDPTPWFYNAIAKQTTNRPVGALQDLQKAIELNDNRLVYRSKLLLDSDEAARSSSLARIYSDLGFQQRALVEGWKSVNINPSSFSSHRFLADTLSVLPRHEIARVSHLLKSQLLQPINITPIPPSIAETNLFSISAGGPANLSFTEFNPLFSRNRIAFQGSGIIGENDTYVGEGIVSGIYNRFSFSSGYTHFETDGWRKNADLDDDIVNVFGQLGLTHKTSIQAEYRYRDANKGDLQLSFFDDNFEPNERNEVTVNTFRLGFHHSFAPGHDLIGNAQYQDADDRLYIDLGGVEADTESDDDAYGGELQYLMRSKNFNLVGGAGYFFIDSEEKLIIKIDFLFDDFIDKDNWGSDLDHTNFYLYSNISLPANVKLKAGLSYDDFNAEKSGLPDESQFNPKFGITWNPFTNTTLRAAAFRTLNRTLITNQTLEPTQVAGFNQFFDEGSATNAWRYGGAIDQKFSPNIYGGAEYTYRDLSIPFYRSPTGTRHAKWDENIYRTYLFWTPHKWLGLSAEYLYEDFDRDKDFDVGAKEVETHYVPLGINFFHPSGLSVRLKGTYINQDGKFSRYQESGTLQDGDDSFWLVDAAISYRLPKRYGFITLGVTNLFDEDFKYFNTDIGNMYVGGGGSESYKSPSLVLPKIQPDRFAFLKLTLAF
jgi:tetratricopeptide (TPR) repeat protein